MEDREYADENEFPYAVRIELQDDSSWIVVVVEKETGEEYGFEFEREVTQHIVTSTTMRALAHYASQVEHFEGVQKEIDEMIGDE